MSPHVESAKKQQRGSHGQFIGDETYTPKIKGVSEDKTPPLISFKLTNPVVYIKLWWKSVMAKEGVDFKFRVHPVTAVLIATVLVAGGASFGWVSKTILTKVPIIQDYIPTPTPIPDPWRDTAYTGILRKVDVGKYYLQTGDGQAVTLSVPDNVNLEKLIGKRIFASGRYNIESQVLLVESATDLEILIQSTSVPTSSPSPTPISGM